MFKKVSIRWKLILSMGLVAIISALIVGGFGYWATVNILRSSAQNELNNEVNLIYGQIKSNVDASIKNYLRAVTEKDKDLVNYYYQQYKEGKVPEADAKAQAAKALLSQMIGESGYVYVVDSRGVIQVHPQPELVNKDLSRYDFIQQQIMKKNGYIEYQWKNPGEKTERPKALYMDYFEPWDWIISTSAYREEFHALVNIKDIRDNILSIKIGKTGYPYIIDTKGNLIIHPYLEEKNIYNSQDEKGNYFIRELLDQKNGQIVYSWKNPGEAKAYEKIVIFKYLPELQYIVAAGIDVDDLYAAAGQYNFVTAVAVIVSVLLALYFSVFIARSLSRPIISLKEVSEEVAAGDYSKQAAVSSRDEIGDLAQVFNKMITQTEKNFSEITNQKAQIEEYSKELEIHKEQLEDFAQHLEEMVHERTSELEASNNELRQAKNHLTKTSGDLKRLLDNTGQGFLYFNEDLRCGNEYSAECLRIFGAGDITGNNIVELLFPTDSAVQSTVKRTLINIFSKGPDMRSVYLSLLPGEVTLNNRVIQLEYRPITDNAYAIGTMMVILTDITDKRVLEQRMEDEKNFLRMVVTAVTNYRDFKYIIDDYRSFCDNLEGLIYRQPSPRKLLDDVYLAIHTFKGNFNQMEMHHIVARLHDLEYKIAQMKRYQKLERHQVQELLLSQDLKVWLKEDLDTLKDVLGESFLDKGNTIEIEVEKLREIEKHIEIVFKPGESRQLLSKLRKLRYQPFRNLLHMYPDYVQKLAQRFEKCVYPVAIENGEFPVDPDRYHDFAKSLVHVFRNTIDHGIEPPEERVNKDKEEYGTIRFKAELADGCIVLTISDDGRGLDIEKIKAQAVASGICSPETADVMKPEEVHQLIFSDGLTTKEEVTDISGRGVGLNAVMNEVEDLHGRIEIATHQDVGTSFRFILPFPEV